MVEPSRNLSLFLAILALAAVIGTARQSPGQMSYEDEPINYSYAHLTAEDRKAILEILRDTKSGLPDYWRSPQDEMARRSSVDREWLGHHPLGFRR